MTNNDKLVELQKDVTEVKTTLTEGVKPTMSRLEAQNQRIIERLDQMAFAPLQDHNDLKDRVDALENWQTQMQPMQSFWNMVTSNLAKIFSGVVVVILILGAAAYIANNLPQVLGG